MAQRSRKRGRRTRSARTTAAAASERATAEQRNAAVRATLTPLEAGERPWPLLASAAVALALVIANLVLLIVNTKVKLGSHHASVSSQVLYLVVMAMCAYGLARARYWAVLGFMVILALIVLVGTLLLIRANNAVGFAVAVVLIVGGGFLFYKLVRVLSRIQMPQPPGSNR